MCATHAVSAAKLRVVDALLEEDQLVRIYPPVNTPPAKAGGFRLRLKAGLVRPLADSDGGCASSYLEIIVRFGRCLVLDIFGPYLIGNISAAGDPISSAP